MRIKEKGNLTECLRFLPRFSWRWSFKKLRLTRVHFIKTSVFQEFCYQNTDIKKYTTLNLCPFRYIDMLNYECLEIFN